MRARATVLVACVLGGPASAAPPSTPASPAPLTVPYGTDPGPAWLAERIANAKAGRREVVRLPLARRSVGWGCVCPDLMVSDTPHSEGLAWVEVEAGPYGELPEAPSGGDPAKSGWVRVVEGVFTGEKGRFVWDDPDPDVVYDLLRLRVLRSRPVRDGERLDLRVVLSGEEAMRDVAPLTGERRFLAVVEGAPLGDAKGLARLEGRRGALAAAGFAGAEVVDSRAAPRLFCCQMLLLGGRFATSREAAAVVEALRAHPALRLSGAYVRQGY